MTDTMKIAVECFVRKQIKHHVVLMNDIPSISEVPPIELSSDIERCCQQGGALLVTLGVLDSRKNVLPLLKGITVLATRGELPIFHLVVVGEGSARAELQAYADQHLPHVVTFVGWQANSLGFLARSAALVHPALHEGISNAILEALALQKPVLASDIEEHRELFQTGAEVLIAPADPQKWAESIAKFLEGGAFRNELNSVCQRAAKRLSFDWNSQAVGVIEQSCEIFFNPKSVAV